MFVSTTISRRKTSPCATCCATAPVWPRHEYSWYGTDFTKEELVHNLRYLEPNKPIRSKFQYNNQCFILAGYIVERVTGKSFEQCLDEYIFGPGHDPFLRLYRGYSGERKPCRAV